MTSLARQAAHLYFPAIVRSEHDSPLDALVAACVPRPEAMDLVAASWADRYSNCLLAFVDGGRPVVVLRTPAGRWAACNALLGSLYATAHEADQRLEKLRKPRREAYVVSLPRGHIHPATPGNLLAKLAAGDADEEISVRRKTQKRQSATTDRKKTPSAVGELAPASDARMPLA